MSSIITSINVDEKDPKFIKIKEQFASILKEKFECENFTSIVDYVMKCVFTDQKSKQMCLKDFNSIFKEKTKEIVEYLWHLIEQTSKEGDVINDIMDQEKESNKKRETKNDNHPKPDNNNNLDKYPKKNERRKNSRDYQKGSNYDKHNKERRGGYQAKFNQGKDRFRVGNKEIIIHSKNRERSRSQSNDDNNNQRRQKDYKDEEEHQGKFQRGYYHPGQRGRFPPMQMQSGIFAPYYPNYPIIGYKDPRRHPYFRQQFKSKRIQKEENNEHQEGEQEKPEAKQQSDKIQNAVEKKENADQKEENIQVNETDEENGDQNKKKVRCKNWPHCKDKNCEYTHPTKTCPFFPNCMFGDKCSFIHPNIPCKYGYQCTRIGCAYSHPPGCNPGMGMYPSMMQPIPFFKHKQAKKNPKVQQGEEETAKEGE